MSSNINSSSINDCDVGEFYTKQYIDQNNIAFIHEFERDNTNPIVFQYQRHIQNENLRLNLKIEDLDRDNTHELIDNFYDIIYLNKSLNHNKKLIVKRYLDGRVSAIEFTITLSCSLNYYGDNCKKFCEVQLPYHYICGENGEKVCDQNWYGPDCIKFCQSRNDGNGHFSCDKDGSQLCFNSWHGDNCSVFCRPQNSKMASYTCDRNGKKKCSKHWYGKDCDTFCSSIHSHYLCDKKSGAILCLKNWYGKNCSVYCKDDEFGNYTCGKATGEKVCRPNYFGDSCQKYCFADVTSNFTCSAKGDKVCHERYHGKKCNIYGKALPLFIIYYLSL